MLNMISTFKKMARLDLCTDMHSILKNVLCSLEVSYWFCLHGWGQDKRKRDRTSWCRAVTPATFNPHGELNRKAVTAAVGSWQYRMGKGQIESRVS